MASDAEAEETQPSKVPFVIAIFAFGLVCIAWLTNLFFLIDLDPNVRGTFGDMFGAVNSAFSGLAFTGVIYAIFLQRQEIEIARTEIKRTKTILDEQQKQLRLQNEEARKQMFENTFFQLLRIFTDLTSQMDVDTQPPVKGKDVFPYFLERLRSRYGVQRPRDFAGDVFQIAYEEFYDRWNKDLGHYYRTIFNIVKFIDKTEFMDFEQKKFYSNILRAQLSDAEAALLFHNGLSRHGREKFKPYMEKYGLLKNVNDKDLLDVARRGEYAADAFGVR